MKVKECTFNARYKLYRDGRFIDLEKDLQEKNPLDVDTLKGEAADAAKRLQTALDRFKDARPAELDRDAGKADDERPTKRNKPGE